jgi:hypothetical protein
MGITDQSVSTAAEEVRLLIITFDGYRWKDVFRGADSVLLFAAEKEKKILLNSLINIWGTIRLREEKNFLI